MNEFFLIKLLFGEQKLAFRKFRKEQDIISQMCIGHTRLTHFFIPGGVLVV